jgi:hypothetical protein
LLSAPALARTGSFQELARLAVISVFDIATSISNFLISLEAFIANSSANIPTSKPKPLATKSSGLWRAKNADVADPENARKAKTDIVFFVVVSLLDRSAASLSFEVTRVENFISLT